MFEETQKTLFCSDLLHQFGDVAPLTSNDLIAPAIAAMHQMQQSPLAASMPYTAQTRGMLAALVELQPGTLATMHGSSCSGDGGRILNELAGAIHDGFEAG